MSENKKLKIVLVNNYWYLRGGSERVVFATKQLLEEAGHEVEIFGMQDPRNIVSNVYFCSSVDFESANGFQKIGSGLKAVYNTEAKKRFAKLIEDFRPDLVHFHNIYHHLSFSLVNVAKKFKVPTVMTLHDYHLISPNHNLYHHGRIDESMCNGAYYKCVLNNCLENVQKSFVATVEMRVRKWKKLDTKIDYYISPSEFLKEKHIRYRFNSDKIFVVRNPLSEIANTHTQDGEDVVYFGRLSVEKGLDTLLDVAKKTPKLDYVLIGEGPLKEALQRRVQFEQIKNVKLVGKKEGEELWDLVTHARIIVVPSVWYENAPMSVAEALQHGKIVVASNIGGIPEMLPKELLCSPGDADDLKKYIETWYFAKKEERVGLAEKLQGKVRTMTDAKVYLSQLLQIYNTVISK